ncbi:alpha/beta fold hydrolase [Streptomyces albipurpureus]|uniref:Esterase FrsA n=1 Tax=Streptomyces albipurpureus TaxID=2897419 RepID=A0ABT0UZZ9_9ACTN|nr:alpha/beta fold hydrolase [Streptomyces sp. CWNU-1]MCM2393816.1 esterase FrsA [Streptomyces sp. CWNU-1]
MNHLEELKEFARLHARGQGISERQVAAVLPRITSDEPGHPGSWARVWSAEADRLAFSGQPLDACRRYALARFPHHGDDDRSRAQLNCVRTFDDWRRRRGIERLVLDHPGGTVAAWAAGLDRSGRRPLVLVMGGIVSVKEQWAPLLPKLARLGYAALATEMPGVGENTLRYRADSWQLLPFLLDQLTGRAKVAQTSVLGLSFSGHLALRAAADDPRIRSVHTVGAPVSHFFTDPLWWPRIPGITRETLRRLTGVADEKELRALLADFALDAKTLGAVRVPVDYVASSRDEIIPAVERQLLAVTLPQLRLKEFDDVHGSPAHLGAMRKWLVGSLLRVRITDSYRRVNQYRRAADRVATATGTGAAAGGSGVRTLSRQHSTTTND